MGWTGSVIPSGKIDRKALCRKHFNWENDASKTEVLMESQVGSTWYAACRTTRKDTGEATVWGAVCLSSIHVEDGVRCFYVKEMDEASGPNEDKCPVRILDLLDKLAPDCSENARRWRDRCRAYHQNNHKHVSNGMLVRFKEPIAFSNGDKFQEFLKCSGGFEVPGKWVRYKISNWRQREFEVSGD
jgi:hypothetical protein